MKTENLKEIGDRIKDIRITKGIKQKDFAKKLSIPTSTLANYETNRRPVSIEVLNKIADALEVSINDLLGVTTTRSEFEEDFDISVFDEDVMKYILMLKKELKKNTSGDNITNTTILQNLVINRIANDKALREIGMYKPKVRLEFTADENGNLLTGKKLETKLKDYYISEHLNRKKDEMIIRVQLLLGGTQYSDEELEEIKNANLEELKNIKKFYYDAYSTYEYEIPEVIKFLLEFDE